MCPVQQRRVQPLQTVHWQALAEHDGRRVNYTLGGSTPHETALLSEKTHFWKRETTGGCLGTKTHKRLSWYHAKARFFQLKQYLIVYINHPLSASMTVTTKLKSSRPDVRSEFGGHLFALTWTRFGAMSDLTTWTFSPTPYFCCFPRCACARARLCVFRFIIYWHSPFPHWSNKWARAKGKVKLTLNELFDRPERLFVLMQKTCWDLSSPFPVWVTVTIKSIFSREKKTEWTRKTMFWRVYVFLNNHLEYLYWTLVLHNVVFLMYLLSICPLHASSDWPRCQVRLWIIVDTLVVRVKRAICMYFSVKKLY